MLVHTALRELCGSDSRYRLFKALYAFPDREYHLRGLAAAAEVDPAQVHKLLPRILGAGLCEKRAAKPHPLYRANRAHPLFDRLKALFHADPIALAGRGGAIETEVDLGEAPVLRSLLWSGRERSHIPAEEAFRNYERNWRFVRREKLGAQERELIERLSRAYGGGLVNG